MSVDIGPNIVKSGLVLYLDSNITKSYPGTGTTWYDISGNNIHFNMVGGVTYTNGYFTNFTEATNYFQIADAANVDKLPLGSAERTILALCQTPSSYHPAYSHVFHYGTDTTNQAFGIAVANGKLTTHPWASPPSSLETITTSTPMFLAVSYTQSNSVHRFYQNSTELSGVNSINAISTGAGAKTARIGSRISKPSEGWQTSGRISVIMIYNRVLSYEEIRKNFATMRGRYGI